MKHSKKLAVAVALITTAAALAGLGYAKSDRGANFERQRPSLVYSDDKVPPIPRAFYDFNVTEPGTFRDFLWVVDSTYDLLISKGVAPSRIHFVVSLRGLTVAYATEGFGQGDPALEAVGEEIRGYLASLQAKGVHIEACLISCQWVGVDPSSLFTGVEVIDNAFAASIWYQNHKFAVIPVHELP